MYGLQKWLWTAVFAVAAVSPVEAQQGNITSGGPTTTGQQRTTSSGSGFSGSSFGSGSNGGLGGNNNAGSQLSSSLLSSLQSSNSQYTNIQSGGSSSLQKSNVFSQFYASPYIASGGQGGSFGQPLYGTTGGSSGGGRNSALTSGFGSGGLGGGGRGQNLSNQQSGIVVPIQAQINYSALMRFQTAPAAATKIQSEIRTVIDGSSMVSNAKGIQVITDQNNNVTLRGTVADSEEARFIEGMVRLTPGVAGIKNELTPTIRTGGK